MKKPVLLAIGLFITFAGTVHAQSENQIGVMLHTGYFPELRIHDSHFSPSMAYGLQVYYYDADYTRLRFGFHYARGYHRSVSYSPGFSVGYVIPLSKTVSLTPEIGLMNYKMEDRTCRVSFRSIMNTLFNVYEPCPDDSHGSINLFVSSEIEIAGPFSIFFRTGYRFMHSSVRRLVDTETETLPSGVTITREYHKTENSFFGTGLEFGVGIKIDLF